MGNERKIFSETCWCGIISFESELIWNDNRLLFEQLLQERAELERALASLAERNFGELYFSLSGTEYRAVFTPINPIFSLCRIFPEKKKLAAAHELDVIKESALGLSSFPSLLRTAFSENDAEGFEYAVQGLAGLAEEIFIGVYNIENSLRADSLYEFVPIRKYLFNTLYRLEWYSERIGSGIAPFIDIGYYSARINYRLFEAALLELVRIVYKSQKSAESCELRIWSESTRKLCLHADFSCKCADPERELEKDIDFLTNALSGLGSKPDIMFGGGRGEISAQIPVLFTDAKDKRNMSTELWLDMKKVMLPESDVCCHDIYSRYTQSGGKVYTFESDKEKLPEERFIEDYRRGADWYILGGLLDKK